VHPTLCHDAVFCTSAILWDLQGSLVVRALLCDAGEIWRLAANVTYWEFPWVPLISTLFSLAQPCATA
jgi:hypothetical protein